MNQPPFGSGQDPTQPIPMQSMPTSPPPPQPIPKQPKEARGSYASPAGGFVPIFGNVPMYLLARLLAFAIDFGAIGFVIAAFAFNATERGFLTLAGRSEGGFGTLVGASLGIAIVFAFLCEALFGATLGKAIFGLRVHRATGGHAGVVRIFVRYLLRPIDLLLVGPLLALATPRHQRIGDFLGGTVVSRYRFGPVASIVGIGLLVAVAYAQAVFGGGITTAVELAAEGANYGPDLIAKTVGFVGIFVPHKAPVDMPPLASPEPTAAPSATTTFEPQPSATPAVVEPSSPATDEPTSSATEAPVTAAPSTEVPAADPTAAPTGGAPVN